MKHLLILLCVTTLVSCGIKDKLLNSTSGALGVPKQPSQNVISVVDDPVVQQPQQPPQPPPLTALVDKQKTPTSDEYVINWYYVLPFVGLAILGLLVYRLKQQNLKSL